MPSEDVYIVRTDTNKGKRGSENREDRKHPSELQIVLFSINSDYNKGSFWELCVRHSLFLILFKDTKS